MRLKKGHSDELLLSIRCSDADWPEDALVVKKRHPKIYNTQTHPEVFQEHHGKPFKKGLVDIMILLQAWTNESIFN